MMQGRLAGSTGVCTTQAPQQNFLAPMAPCLCLRLCMRVPLRKMIAFITFKSSLVPLIEDLCSSNPCGFEFLGVRRNRTDDLGINRPSL